MAVVKQMLHIEINPLQPVSEICATITAICGYNSAQESDILAKVAEAIERRQKELKGVETK